MLHCTFFSTNEKNIFSQNLQVVVNLPSGEIVVPCERLAPSYGRAGWRAPSFRCVHVKTRMAYGMVHGRHFGLNRCIRGPPGGKH